MNYNLNPSFQRVSKEEFDDYVSGHDYTRTGWSNAIAYKCARRKKVFAVIMKAKGESDEYWLEWPR